MYFISLLYPAAVPIKTTGAYLAVDFTVYHSALPNCCVITVGVLVPATEHVCFPGLQFIRIL